MKQTQIIFRFLFPPRQDAAEAVHPTVRTLHNPAASFETSLPFDSLRFLATCTNVGCITKLFYQISYLARIITLIQAYTLRLFLCRLRPFYRNTFYRRLYHFAVMPVCSGNCQANWYAGCLGQQTPFNAFFGLIRRVWAGFFPRQAGLLLWHRPSTARTNQSLSTGRSLSEPVPRVGEKHRLWSTPEIASALCCSNKYQSRSRRSIDNRFAAQKIFHSLLCGPALSACHHRNDAYSGASVSAARFFPIVRLKSGICFWFFVFSSLNPFKGTIAFEYIGDSGVIRIGSNSLELSLLGEAIFKALPQGVLAMHPRC